MRDGATYKVKAKRDGFCVLKRVRAAACDCLELPKYFDGMYIDEIGAGAFKGTAIKTVVIPDCVTRLAPKAFCGSDIESVVVPETVKFIGKAAFYDCVNLRSVVIKNTNAVIQSKLFDKCYHIAQADVPLAALSGNWVSRVADITVTGSGRLADGTFEDNKRLCRVELGGGITEVGERAFSGCSELKELVLQSGLRAIESEAFSFTSLVEVALPDTVEEIEAGAFCDCGIKTFTVDKNNKVYHSAGNCVIHTADKRLVAGCSYSVIPSDGSVMSIGERAFEGCDEMTGIEIPACITDIGDNAFSWCDELIAVELPEGVRRVGDWAFEKCTALETVILPASLERLGFAAIDECPSLESICYNGTAEQWQKIDKDPNWNFTDIQTVHCVDGDIEL